MKLIGIVGRTYYNQDKQTIIQTHDALRRTLMKYNDVICITIHPTEDIDYFSIEPGTDNVNNKIDYLLDKCDGFIIPGGTYANNLDEYVIKYAIKNDKPLLAICLGFQMLCNIFAQDRNDFDMTRFNKTSNHYAPSNEYKHKVILKDNTLLKDILKEDEINVNSVHHNFVNFPLKELIISSISDDNIIESVEYPNKKCIIGVQWHPEYLFDDNSKKIFDYFLK